ncbi:ABC transporter permease [Sediminibacillus massiliensis]|uniref:ABC transporter permease n=1 Tax=Sediminibacillus massiliensis TaxID=1926277 RepID=UPI0009883166|nr:ABC transporter permease subunit [Sediminibacillus massiliensis]
MQWITILKKEMLENWRNIKWIWVPLVFVVLSIMDPLSTYYLPQILESVGGLPEGSVFEIPETAPEDALMMSLSQLSFIGVAIVVLISRGMIAGERKSGVAELVLVKPVSYLTYISGKWTAQLALVLTSLFAGLLSSWYYVNLLFGDLSFLSFIRVFCFYGLWMMLVLTVTTFFSALFRSPGLVAFVSLATLAVMSVVKSIFSHILTWYPNNISAQIRDMLAQGSVPEDLWGTSIVTILLIIVLMTAALFVFKGKEMA